ncbi:MAG: hypothetical protein NTU95_01935 [Methanothrix sp.]|nr:hypothetical protein [Methanothrix sp.]
MTWIRSAVRKHIMGGASSPLHGDDQLIMIYPLGMVPFLATTLLHQACTANRPADSCDIGGRCSPAECGWRIRANMLK